MTVTGPIVVGGNGHSGTRVFCDIITLGGVFTGLRRVTKRSASADLRIIDLLNRWVEPYVYKRLTSDQKDKMRREFGRRLRLYFPWRSMPWGFKNPRTMLILPFLDQMMEGTRFIHVIRDGRDIALGNPFVTRNRLVDAFVTEAESNLGPEEKMTLFWGRSNEAAWKYGTESMGERYLLIRWEDLCRDPLRMTEKVYRFAGCTRGDVEEIAKIVRKPSSLGRWATFPEDVRERVAARGRPWLSQFGYD